jgi:hypothetical protein
MAVTLAQSAAICQDTMVKGIIQELIKAEPVFQKLPFQEIVGNALAFNREDEANMPSVEWRSVNGLWTESTGGFTPVTYGLKILGGDCDVDNFIRKTRSNVNDQMAVQVKLKTKVMAHQFADTLVYGVSSNSNEFDGLHQMLTPLTGQQIHAGSGTTGGPLTTALMDQLLDLVIAGDADFILMNKAIRRRLSAYLRTVGSYQTERTEYGNYWVMWQEVPILVSDFLLQTETISGGAYATKTGGSCSSVFAVHLGEGDGLCGIQNGGIETEVWERLEQKDASRTRIKWYPGLALYATKAIARIDGVTDAAVSA